MDKNQPELLEGLLNVDIGHLLAPEEPAHGDGPDGPETTGFVTRDDYRQLASRYGTLFADFKAGLRDHLSPMTLSFGEVAIIPRIKTLARQLREKYDNVLLLGIGGSALGARAVLQFMRGPHYNLENHGHPRLFVLDNIDPVVTRQVENLLDMSRTAIIYTSKSGSTPETAAQFIYFYQKYKDAGGDVKDIVICCDPGDNGINRIARELGCHLFHIPKKLGGRFSVLSSVGFLPGEIAGIKCDGLLAGASDMHRYIIKTPPEQNALFTLGGCLHTLARQGKSIHVLFNYSNLLSEFGLWFVQLWAESLGKRLSNTGAVVNAGTTPMTSVGTTDQHSILQLYKEGPGDKVFGFVNLGKVADELVLPGAFQSEKEYAYFGGHTMQEQLQIEQLSTEMSLVRAGRPCYRITLGDRSEEALGALFYFYQALTVFTAALWDVNPYDQPGVEEGKNITYTLMGREDYNHRRQEYEQAVEQYNRESETFIIDG